MVEPDREVAEVLLNKLHCPNQPYWTSAEQEEAYKQFKRLFEHWFRVEID